MIFGKFSYLHIIRTARLLETSEYEWSPTSDYKININIFLLFCRQSCCDGSKAPAKICSASAKIWDKKQQALPDVHPSTNPSTGERLSDKDFMGPIIAEWEKKSNLIQVSLDFLLNLQVSFHELFLI